MGLRRGACSSQGGLLGYRGRPASCWDAAPLGGPEMNAQRRLYCSRWRPQRQVPFCALGLPSASPAWAIEGSWAGRAGDSDRNAHDRGRLSGTPEPCGRWDNFEPRTQVDWARWHAGARVGWDAGDYCAGVCGLRKMGAARDTHKERRRQRWTRGRVRFPFDSTRRLWP
ncbi:hypothetical protein K491DRAFT_269702 [Lophiostoma macrostomum CBS 122681]|uniref:Uncharacterized protein n=1 Tax=Lophiostoma macrostomum CBS 122681 TaxID=1314788 RepID=A0A6A6THQ3_9PLEO|nr:hypothetical protein K491DRAFT_269702 [Lophiostoma macrostomum CBS 122681]